MGSHRSVSSLTAKALVLPTQLHGRPLPVQHDPPWMPVHQIEQHSKLFVVQIGLKFLKDLPGSYDEKLSKAVYKLGAGRVGRCPPEPKDPHVGVQDDALSPDSHVRRPLPGSAVRPSKSPRLAGPASPPCGAAGGTSRTRPLAPFGVQGPPPDQAGVPVPPAGGQLSAGPTLRSLPSFRLSQVGKREGAGSLPRSHCTAGASA